MWNNQGYGGGYDQGQGDQGGGYLNSPGNFGSPGQSQERKSRQRAQNFIPCTVAMILSAQQEQDKFVIDNIELNQVTIVGLVRSVQEQATRLDYEIDDMTGPPIEVKQFIDIDSENDEDRQPPMRENTYVRVCGHVRAFNNKMSITAFKVMPVVDMNELTGHMLEVIHSHLVLTKAGGGAGGNSTMMDASTSGYGNTGNSGSDYAGAQGDGMNGLTPIQKQVQLVIRGSNNDQGVGVGFICEKLRGIPERAIREAIEFLSGEGHIYSTIDDEHFKSTDSM